VLGDDSGVLGGPAIFSTAPSTSGVGPYAIGVAGLTSLNYEITFLTER